MSENSGTGVVLEAQVEAVAPPAAADGPMDIRLPWARWEVWAFVIIVVLALGLRLWALGARAIQHDESLHAIYSWYIYEGRGYTHDPMMHGPFKFYATAAVYWLLWANDATARLLPALFGTALVAVPIMLRRRLGRTGTLVTSLLLALSPTMLYFSRFARDDMYMAVWALLLVAFMWGYLDTRKSRYLVLSSVALAFAFSTMENVYIVVAVLGSYLFIASATDVVPWLLGRKRLRDFSPGGQFLILMATLVLPLGAACIGLFQHTLGITLANPDWTAGPVGMPKGPGLYVAFVVVVTLFVAAVAIGLRWRPWVWLVCFGAFATVWVLLYSSFFANFPGGLLSGLWQSLGYWVVQHEVARGGQPWYYYIVVGLNYEFLPMLVGSAAAAYYLVKGDRFSLFLVYWAVGSFLLYSYAGEKMPWLLVNVALPFILLAGKALGSLLEREPWGRVTLSQIDGQTPICPECQWVNYLEARVCVRCGTTLPVEASPDSTPSLPQVTPTPVGPVNPRLRLWLRSIRWPAVAFTFMLALLVAVAGRWLVLALAKESGMSLGLNLLLALLVPAMIAACIYLIWQAGQGKRLALLVVSLAGVMLALSVQAALRAAYANPNMPVEMLVYAQGGQDIPQVMAEIERLGRETGKGRNLKITVDTNTWPWAWYLRDYKLVGYPCYGNESGACRSMDQTPDADVVLLAAGNQASAERFMSGYGMPVKYTHLWWFSESYRGITRKTVWEGLRKRESLCRVADYFVYRNFGLPDLSADSYAYFPKDFTLAPVGPNVAGNKSRC
ncbi:MAG: TIGR03663 family protein [Dehalococcoidia bacterium]|nr:TIGR03663 family protein [Dehalococcoidia bacterium]